MWENEYQSRMCWEFSALCTTPCQSFTVPQVQIGTRPMASSTAAWIASAPARTSSPARSGERMAPVTF